MNHLSFIIFSIVISNILAVNHDKNYQDYDMYVFALQWGPNYCLGKAEQEKLKCQEYLKAIPKNKVSIHGLWPNLQSGRMLQDCNQGEEIEVIDDGSEVFTKMKKFWATLEPKNTNKVFWEHEYNKHGYCYSDMIHDYDPKRYFEKAFEVFEEYDFQNLVLNAFGTQPAGEFSVDANTFYSKMDSIFGGRFYYVTCKNIDGKGYVSEIRVNLDLEFKPFKNSKINENASCKRGRNLIFLMQ